MSKGDLVRRPATALIIGAIAFAAAGCGGSAKGSSNDGSQPDANTPAQHPTALVGEVGKNDAFTISLSDDHGTQITNLAAGTYKLTVHDDSSIHNFHLAGAGVNEITSVGNKGVETFTVTFKPGTYTFVCDPHAGTMNGHFRVS